MGFNNTTNTGALTTGLTDFNVPLQRNNLYLHTATETDPTVISELVSAVNSGEVSRITPFVYCQKYGSSASASNAMLHMEIHY